MKTAASKSVNNRQQSQNGFTILEMMVTVFVMGFVILGALSGNLLSFRENTFMEGKAGASDVARRATIQMLEEIRSAKGYDIGNMSGSSFAAITNGSYQGTCLMIYCDNPTNNIIDNSGRILYYLDSSGSDGATNTLLRRQDNFGGGSIIVVSNLINASSFTSEDGSGQVQRMRTYKGIVHTTLQFNMFGRPPIVVNTNALYKNFGLDCKATPRLPDGA
jgi:prepilin-type N-terminal cleavage/methylation domain-containing protein